MAHLAVSQAALAVPVGSDSSSLRRSVLKTYSLGFTDRSWAPALTLDLKLRNASLKNRHVVCMSVQQASRSKVLVSPLELENAKDPPLNTYKPKEPYTATIVSVERVVGSKAPGETCHIVIDHDGNVPYWEGQSYGVIPPGENPKKPGAPHNVRLYSIASTRYGDNFDGKTASLCVRRAVYYDPETGKEDPSKNGICSNFLCNSKPGDKVKITGPSGKIMLLPEDDPNATHIMIATGTGVAPYRGYLRRMFMESVPTFNFGGLAWLFLGVANTDSLLYDDEFTQYLKDHPGHFRYDRALSREQKNKTGGKMYVQDKIEEYSDEIFKLLDNGAHIYFCGLKGMMPGIQDTLKRVAEERGESWEQKLSQLKKNKQWHVEVY
ncbi:putative ferredoxin--NADP reductase [Tripterygium wilfordii]|uniref:Ferredoxin--NADP reductase, chloroplastic n=1 Tax=Tripterygium wilfordii TaxID=458696 RepID=A0A7J7E232_TRIWF|nr:ferredoxin--NADP reductase, root isozyme, chloroplastic [Tripterygium wilfordii]KAF5752700.1 putative ferredoxin--NADP reductase [Tripterygium wilfordii]